MASLVDGTVVAKWRRELTETLGAHVLELDVYLKDLVPATCVSNEIRRKLVALITEHMGDLQDRTDLTRALAKCPIVECRDGQFRAGPEVYFDDPLVLAVLGRSVPIAVGSTSRPEAQRSALAWLGVTSRPRPSEILVRVKELTRTHVDAISKSAIKQVLWGLSSEWAHYSQDQSLDDLRLMAWLPARGSKDWHRPTEVFAIFSEHLFSTVGTFLDVSRDVQQSAQQTGVKLLDRLGVRSEPTVAMVVRHLINLSANGSEPNPAIYPFLSNTKEQEALRPLKTVACLWSGGRYHRPSTVFLEEHTFGTRRYTLDRDWLKYAPLLQALDVKRFPDAADAREVLLEIASDHASHEPLGDTDFLTVGSCWHVISDGLESIDDNWFEELTHRPVVPNADRILTKPTWLFFRDRPRLAEPFGALLANNVIDRPSGAARGMAKAGVRPLSTAVEVDLVECDDPVAATDIESVLQDRLPLIRRVLESSALSHLSEDVLAVPSVYWATRLEVIYRVFLGDRYFPSQQPQSVSAHLDRSSGHLYVARQTRGWQTVVARELAFAAIPDPSAAHLAAVVEIILGAGDLAEAAVRLDDLGFAPAEVRLDVPVPAPPLDAPDAVSTDEFPQEPPEEARQLGTGTEPTTAQRLPTSGIPAPSAGPSGGGVNTALGVGARSGGVRPQGGVGRSSRGALRSYVVTHEPPDEREPLSDTAKLRRSEADETGIDSVMRYEYAARRSPKEMDHFHEGYDIESCDATGVLDRVIEVKSLSGTWSGYGVGLSAPQFRCAQDRGDQFWLYVVEFAGQPNEKLHRIQNPARRVDDYRFDDGWEGVAE